MAISVRGLQVRFGRRMAVDGLDLDVLPGAITGFLGHNGAGKTSAMRGLLGLCPRTCSSLVVDGIEVRGRDWILRARTGAVIETASFQPGWSAERNLVELARLQGLGRREAREEAGRRLEQVGLAEAAARDPREFSQGMRQRLALGQALLGGRGTLLLDEPTNGLDPEGIADLWAVLRELRDSEGAAILLSSHLLGEVESLCDRVVVLREGRKVADGSVEDLRRVSGNRYELVAERPEAAVGVLEELEPGSSAEPPFSDTDRARVDLGDHDPADVLERLVTSGARPRSFAPAGGGLTEIYSAAAAGALSNQPADSPQVSSELAAAPQRSSTLRMFAYEARRHLRVVWLLGLPAVASALPILALAARYAADSAEVEGAARFSTTAVTAFRGTAAGLSLGLPVAVLTATLLSSQLVAGELGRGSLRNVALRPLSRLQLAIAKLATSVGLGLAFAGTAIATSIAIAASLFEFGDLEEEIMGGLMHPIMPAEEVWPDFQHALTGGLAIAVAFSVAGFMAGSWLRRGVTAVGSSLALLLTLVSVRWLTAGAEWEAFNPATYLPFVSADASRIHALSILAGGAANVPFEYGATEYSVPAAMAVVCGGLGIAATLRRRIP